MSRLPAALRRYAADVRTAVAAAPVEAALAVGLAVCLSISFREPTFTEDEFVRVAASVALAFPLVFGFSYLRARNAASAAARWAGTAAALGLSAWLGIAWMDDGHAAEGWRWVLLAAAAVLLLLLAPAVPPGRRDRREVWAFAARLVARGVGIGLYAGVLYALLAGAVAAVVSLFDLRHPEHLYGDLAGAVFFALAPLMLVGGIHRLAAPPEPGVPPAVGVLGRWLYAPALVVYLVILYAYGLKVVATGELPRNLLSPLVIAAGLIGLLGGFLLHPVHESAEHRGLSTLVRAVPAALLPLVPLAVWALAARLGEYGWTEFRYVRLAAVVAIGVLATLGTLRLVRRRPPLLTTVPAVLAAVLLVAALGPWSATAVSRRDQTARLRAAFAEAGVDPRRLPADTVVVDSAAFVRMEDGARYLVGTHGVEALREVVPAIPDTTRDVWAMGEVLGLRRRCAPGPPTTLSLDWRPGVPSVAGGTLRDVRIDSRRTFVGGTLGLRLDGDDVVAEGRGWAARASLRPLIPRSGAAMPCADRRTHTAHFQGEAALLELRDEGGRLRAQLVVTSIVMGDPFPAAVRGLLVVPD